jgi:alkylated DNA repair dioxygenase AlkB
VTETADLFGDRDGAGNAGGRGLDAPAPDGFRYVSDFLQEAEERDLLSEVRTLPFNEVRMRGQVARRRTTHFGWLYGYESWRITPGPPIPAFLLPLRDRVAGLLGVPPGDLAEVLVTEYLSGAGIGWHRDAPMFGDVAGISLLGPCRFRFRRERDGIRQTRDLTLAPRSAYVLAGAARWQWQHSIPPGRSPRYSITFRTLRDPGSRAGRGRGADRRGGHGKNPGTPGSGALQCARPGA